MSDRPDSDHQWWYCLKHNAPEYGPGCPGKYRLGPYPDEATAASALRIAEERNEAWEEQDERD
ncbi:hypothetical protein ACQEU5_01540 [Marinactinospora thermotolerans]|uniref:SPOR domain-containing protein n=1 Tax=Marinactinospora thermotolerans DSM 45154 TaxID=1122192 RepID=A0A1T4M9Y9_9ACTN|nr:hypothetical protein [Marinactinospora thermotolerans]SJZ63809.1 hypothetical protein SAMN02745673_01018 [Marinactinospora thermotolerans DSM 45154]